MPKMKEIQKVVQKLSPGQESAAGGGGGVYEPVVPIIGTLFQQISDSRR